MLNKILFFLNKHKTRILLLILSLIFLAICAFFYENKAFSISFGDEQDNFVLGKYLLNNEKLYSQLFSHHQPLGYIISAAVQEVTSPNSLFLLIKRHREFIILWSSLWSLLLVLRFGRKLFLFTVFYEITKIFIFGNLFLAESLVVYPLIYVASSIYITRKIDYLESFLLGSCIALSIFLLAPVWPLVLLLTVAVIYKFLIKNKKLLIWFLIGFLPWIFISLYFSSFDKYLYNVFVINLKYYTNTHL